MINSFRPRSRLAGVPEEVTWEGGHVMAVPMRFFPSKLFEGRGGSVFDSRDGSFDALDECWSQWMDALRKARTKEYVPEALLPRDPSTGAPLIPSYPTLRCAFGRIVRRCFVVRAANMIGGPYGHFDRHGYLHGLLGCYRNRRIG